MVLTGCWSVYIYNILLLHSFKQEIYKLSLNHVTLQDFIVTLFMIL